MTEPKKMSLEVRASGEVVAKTRTGRMSKRVASRHKVGGGDRTEQNEPMGGELMERL